MTDDKWFMFSCARKKEINLAAFANDIFELGYNLTASGGTAKYLRAEGFEVLPVEDMVQRSILTVLMADPRMKKLFDDSVLTVQDLEEMLSPIGGPMLNHRVVTLVHPVHAGLIAKDTPEDRAELARHGIPWISGLFVDIYQTQDYIDQGKSFDEVVENIDIGGPTLLRSAAKGKSGRVFSGEVDHWQNIIDWEFAGRPNEDKFALDMQRRAERFVSEYTGSNADYLDQEFQRRTTI